MDDDPTETLGETLGDRLKAARIAAGLSQPELVTLSGVSLSTISGIESNRRVHVSARILNVLSAAVKKDLRPTPKGALNPANRVVTVGDPQQLAPQQPQSFPPHSLPESDSARLARILELVEDLSRTVALLADGQAQALDAIQGVHEALEQRDAAPVT